MALNWLKYYLPDRTQFVYVYNESYMYTKVCYGFPQGSVLWFDKRVLSETMILIFSTIQMTSSIIYPTNLTKPTD